MWSVGSFQGAARLGMSVRRQSRIISAQITPRGRPAARLPSGSPAGRWDRQQLSQGWELYNRVCSLTYGQTQPPERGDAGGEQHHVDPPRPPRRLGSARLMTTKTGTPRRAVTVVGNETVKGLRHGWSERLKILIQLPLFVRWCCRPASPSAGARQSPTAANSPGPSTRARPAGCCWAWPPSPTPGPALAHRGGAATPLLVVGAAKLALAIAGITTGWKGLRRPRRSHKGQPIRT